MGGLRGFRDQVGGRARGARRSVRAARRFVNSPCPPPRNRNTRMLMTTAASIPANTHRSVSRCCRFGLVRLV